MKKLLIFFERNNACKKRPKEPNPNHQKALKPSVSARSQTPNVADAPKTVASKENVTKLKRCFFPATIKSSKFFTLKKSFNAMKKRTAK